MNTNYTFEQAFQDVEKLQAAEGAQISDHIIKLMEEVGEISESYLMLKSYKRPKAEAAEEKLHLQEEAVDAIIVCLAILATAEASPNFVSDTLKTKIEKWKNNLAK